MQEYKQLPHKNALVVKGDNHLLLDGSSILPNLTQQNTTDGAAQEVEDGD